MRLNPPTLGRALRVAAQRWPDRPALLAPVGPGRGAGEIRLSYQELDHEVDRLAALLRQVGVEAGDVVGFLIHKRPEVVTGFLACARMGAVMAPINFKLHPDHVRDQLRTAAIGTLFTQRDMDPLLEQLLPDLPDARKIIYVDGPGRYGTSHVGQEPGLVLSLDEPPDPRAPCYLNYTSGTTGRPKGAVTTHQNILENGRQTIDALGFRDDDVFLGMFSVFAHPHELFHRSLLVGGAFVILDTLSPRVVCQIVAQFGVTWMMAVPSFYEMMLDHAPDRRVLQSLRVLESGGAYVGPETLHRMEATFAAHFLPVWGCTEATGVALANGPEQRRPGATGLPVPGYEIEIVDEAGEIVDIGQVGELRLRGPAVVQGYLNAPEETGDLFRDGWYHTRDLVRQDTDGFVYFEGRKSDLLKIGGIRVYPLEIEKVLAEHPDVVRVVVVRAEERLRGEIARAVVQVREGSGVSGRELARYCRDHLAVYKVPRLIEFWAQVPLLPNGKIDKQAVLAVPPDPARDERAPARGDP